MNPRVSIQRRRAARTGGFALVVALLLLLLIGILAVGLTGIASIELRRTSNVEQAARAKANARIALLQAIGQLQKTLGPDQRVSASAEILAGNPKQPHWTGAWKSTREDGSSFFERDDLAGGLDDARSTLKTSPEERVIEWLVSGKGSPLKEVENDPAILFQHADGTKLEVPKVALKNAGGAVSGHQAWWTGDLGIRANISNHDDGNNRQAARSDSTSRSRAMISQAADHSIMKDAVPFEDGEITRLGSTGTLSLTSVGHKWVSEHMFDLTVDSLGVIADVAEGGLKRDLTAYFAGSGDVPAWKNLAGLSADDSLAGDRPGDKETASRHLKSGPRFGLLRDWARSGLTSSGKAMASKLSESDASAGTSSRSYSLANEKPVKLAGNLSADLQPILVEATNFTHISALKTPNSLYQLRHHHYPRVVLWNPYNVELDFDRSMIMIQGNGRQEMWTTNVTKDSKGRITSRRQSEWLSFEGGRGTASDFEGSDTVSTKGYNDPYIGSYYFAIPKTRFGPGECLVFSPARQAEYDCASPYRTGAYNLNANELSCEVAPDPSRSYYISNTKISGGLTDIPIEFWFAPTPSWSSGGRNGVENQSDDTRAVLKSIGTGTVTFADFDKAPQISLLSASLQYGAGREPRIAWSSAEKMPIELLDRVDPRPTVIPNKRTREGIRLRWFDEHTSNLINSGKLSGSSHFEDSLLGNWNPRAAFSVRSPWENIAGTMPKTGTAGGPWFFGAYTRDLYDDAIGWAEQVPFLSGGRYHGNPFGPPQEGNGRYVLFDLPREETGVISLGQLQHAKISELIWHPSYAIGNSLADPRLGSGGNKGLNRTAVVAPAAAAVKLGGFHESQLGWSSDTQRSGSKGEWAATARAILGEVPKSDNLVYDLSFEANRTLWDRYYLSSGTPAEKRKFVEDPAKNPLPNSRMRLLPGSSPPAADDALEDFHRSASRLMVDGAFNVNSTRVEAWKALLGSTRLSGYGHDEDVPFPRVLDAPDGAWKNGDSSGGDEVWSGHRELSPGEIHQLAVAIVAEVKLRGPFISLSDFVNRRLAEDETGRMGALQAAIEKSGLNSTLTAAYPLDNRASLPDYKHPDNIPDATLMEQTLKPASKAWGAPGYLTQADILQVLGPVLSARSDTFVIRAYGDATDATGTVTARAWCEAVVQRTPQPLDPDESGLNSRLQGKPGDFGRRFVVTSFRWLSPGEI